MRKSTRRIPSQQATSRVPLPRNESLFVTEREAVQRENPVSKSCKATVHSSHSDTSRICVQNVLMFDAVNQQSGAKPPKKVEFLLLVTHALLSGSSHKILVELCHSQPPLTCAGTQSVAHRVRTQCVRVLFPAPCVRSTGGDVKL